MGKEVVVIKPLNRKMDGSKILFHMYSSSYKGYLQGLSTIQVVVNPVQ